MNQGQLTASLWDPSVLVFIDRRARVGKFTLVGQSSLASLTVFNNNWNQISFQQEVRGQRSKWRPQWAGLTLHKKMNRAKQDNRSVFSKSVKTNLVYLCSNVTKYYRTIWQPMFLDKNYESWVNNSLREVSQKCVQSLCEAGLRRFTETVVDRKTQTQHSIIQRIISNNSFLTNQK